jgi:hypothetical protein
MIFLAGCTTISTKKFTYIKTEIQPVYEWEITAELIAYDAERNRKVTEKPDQFTLEVRSYTIDKMDKKLTLDTQHELRIDSVIVNYANLAKTFTGHSSYEDNKTNKRYITKDGEDLGRLGQDYLRKRIGEIPGGINEAIVIVYGTTRNRVMGEETFVRKFNLKLYKDSSKWPKILEGK